MCQLKGSLIQIINLHAILYFEANIPIRIVLRRHLWKNKNQCKQGKLIFWVNEPFNIVVHFIKQDCT